MDNSQRSWSAVVANKDHRNQSQRDHTHRDSPRGYSMDIASPIPVPPLASHLYTDGTEQIAAHRQFVPDLMSDSMLTAQHAGDLRMTQGFVDSHDADMTVFDDKFDFHNDPGNFEPLDIFASHDDPGYEPHSSGHDAQVAHPVLMIYDEQGHVHEDTTALQSSAGEDSDSPEDAGQSDVSFDMDANDMIVATHSDEFPRPGLDTGPWPWSLHAMHPVMQDGSLTDHTMYNFINSDSQPSPIQQTFSRRDVRTSATSSHPPLFDAFNSREPQHRALPYHLKTQGLPQQSTERKLYAHVVRDGPEQGFACGQTFLSPGWDTRASVSCQSRQDDAASRITSPTASVYSALSNPVPLPAVLQCRLCGIEYTGRHRKGSLHRHLRLNHGKTGEKRGYTCEHCDHLPFRRQDARLNHYRKKHPELNTAPAVPRAQENRRSRGH